MTIQFIDYLQFIDYPKLQFIDYVEDATGGEARGEDEIAATFASHLEQSHRMHEGPLYCEETRKTVDQKINNSIRIFTPCFPPAKDEQGDDHFLAEPFMPDDISSALKRCKSKTAAGGDRINYTTLKHTMPKLIGILAQLFTICFMVGYFPVAWKSATGIMLLKPGKEAKKPGSYRPISLLSCAGKLFEKVIYPPSSTFIYATSNSTPRFNERLDKASRGENTYTDLPKR